MNRDNFKPLTLQDTDFLKGLALLLLLCHHLFYIDNGLYDSISIAGHNVIQVIGQWSKVCVAIFIFLSGYGLMYQTIRDGKIESLKRFYWHRYTKLFVNYWFIWLVFVPIGVFIFGRSFHDSYGAYMPIKVFLDFFGLINAFGWLGYNATWWFYSCIILLYASFPFLYWSYKKDVLLTTLLVAVVCFFPTPIFAGGKLYFGAFYMGMIYCDYCKVTQLPPPHIRVSKVSISILIFILVLASIDRLASKAAIIFDSFLVLSMVLVYKNIHIHRWICRVFEFLGKHSMNIFLFHTFIFSHWFKQEIYASRNPLVIYFTLLLACIVISITLEKIKKLI